MWSPFQGLEHNYTPVNIKEVVISRSASFASTGFCQPKSVLDETFSDLQYCGEEINEVKVSKVDTNVDCISDGSASSHDLPLAYEDSNSFHDINDKSATESAAEVETHGIAEPQEITLSSNSYCDMNIIPSVKPEGTYTTVSMEVNEDQYITKNEGYLSTTSLVLMDVMPLDIEDHLHLDSSGYVTKQFSFDFNNN